VRLVAAVAELGSLGGFTRMDSSTVTHIGAFRLTRIATIVACIFFLPAIAFSPSPFSSLGMRWPVFFCTWGVMLLAAFVAFAGYFRCRQRGQAVSVFYALCPALLFAAFLCVLFLRDIIAAFT